MNTHIAPLDGPADTRTMGIVHSALRRDLVRARLVLGTPMSAEPARRTALAEHLRWLVHFLHHHHSGEDEGLYPLVVRRNPDSAALVEQMDADHGSITPAMDRLDDAARRHLEDPASPDHLLLAALNDLVAVLNPHLEREETVMMPVVASSITEREWRAWDEQYNLKAKGLGELAMEGHWIIDGLDDAGRDHVEHLVPAVPRFILIRLMGGRYRRLRATLWGRTPALDVPSLPVEKAGSWAA